jgi:putative addiction module component (TIGR02574 family)
MTDSARQVLSHALALSSEDRADIAYELLSSLEAKPVQRDEEEWLAEVERRAREALAGAPGTPWPEARERIAERLHRR